MNRLNKLMKKMEEKDMQSLFITNPKNVQYLTGFTGEESYLLILKEGCFFVTDGRYVDQAKQEIPKEISVIRWSSGLLEECIALVKSASAKEVYFEANHLTYIEAKKWIDGIDIQARDAENIVESLRAVKDELEISYIKKAADIVDQTFLHILNLIQPGISERRIAAEMEYYMKKLGSEGTSFETIVASGIRSSFPHGEASEKIIVLGDIVTLDFGALYKGYASDMTRTISVGNVTDKWEEIYQLVLTAEEIGLDTIRAGMKSCELDKAIRKPIREKNLNQYFSHGAGHSIGLDIHESPFISGKSNEVFQKNMVQTIEPGIYLPNEAGIRIEDDVLVQDEKGILLTKAPKREFIHLPFK